MNSDQTLGPWQASIGNDAQGHLHKAAPTQQSARQAGTPMPHPSMAGSIELRKKSILLVDCNVRSRESRAKVMRALGVHVDCVANAHAARARLAAETYNLILVDLGRDIDAAESLVHEIRTRNSRQLVGFLVGSPLFIATSLNTSNSRPRRAPAPPTGASVAKPSTPAFPATDFGQKIRDAEGKKIA
jgi:CheY-like chemotaxis protein